MIGYFGSHASGNASPPDAFEPDHATTCSIVVVVGSSDRLEAVGCDVRVDRVRDGIRLVAHHAPPLNPIEQLRRNTIFPGELEALRRVRPIRRLMQRMNVLTL